MQENVQRADATTLERFEMAVERLRETAVAVSQALQEAGVPHAVIGGLAVASHVAQQDPSAARATRDFGILIRREDVSRAAKALRPLGYEARTGLGFTAFMPKGQGIREAVHAVYAGEKVRATYPHPAPELNARAIQADRDGFLRLSVSALLTMKLTSYRLKDRVHVQDLLAVGLVTPKVKADLPADLKARLDEVRRQTAEEQ